MLANWIDADGCRARAKMGDPVSGLDDIIYRASNAEGDRALAQERDRAREWLDESDTEVFRSERGYWSAMRFASGEPCESQFVLICGKWVKFSPDSLLDHFQDYDAALITAVLATEKAAT